MKKPKLKPILLGLAFASLFAHNVYLQMRIEVAIDFAESAADDAESARRYSSNASEYAESAEQEARDAVKFARDARDYAEEARDYSFAYNCNYCPWRRTNILWREYNTTDSCH